MADGFSLGGVVGWAFRALWPFVLLGALLWWGSRRGPYRFLLMNRGQGLATVMFLFATLVVVRWAGTVSGAGAWSAPPIFAALIVGNLAFILWGASVAARAETGGARRVAVRFFLLSLVPGGLILVRLL